MVGFGEVLIVMGAVLFIAHRYERRRPDLFHHDE
jgi:hypothetical protein